ncbi:MAG TPA: MFS transporter [Candidatus Binataceae bacterium]|nr:MFS transporter [Candidatus Binataceae bacterium]
MSDSTTKRRPLAHPEVSAGDSHAAGRESHGGLSRIQLIAMAVATGVSAANVHFCQPLLAQIAAGFSLSVRGVSAIPTVTLIGYALGLALFVPLGDLFERRRLVVLLVSATAVALILAALAPSLLLLSLASLMVGAFASVVQVVVPFAATVAAPAERGRAVGFVTGGMLFGILLARTVSGLIGGAFGWRVMYAVAAAAMGALALTLRELLPVSHPHPSAPVSYRALMASVFELARTMPVLREAALLGGLVFGALMAFWTTLVFFVALPPYFYGAQAAGMFGLVGVVGALAAPAAGHFSDRRNPRLAIGIALVAGLISYAVLGLAGHRLAGLIVGIVLLDFSAQVNHVSNQTRIYALMPEARSRLNTVYMVIYFCCGALGAFLAANAWSAWGWSGVCILGAALFIAASLIAIRGAVAHRG